MIFGDYDNGSASGNGRSEYIWLPTPDGAIPVGMYRNGKYYAIHTDHLGSPRLMTDEQNKPVWQWPYSAFGAVEPTGVLKATPKTPMAGTTQSVALKKTVPEQDLTMRFPGQMRDVETNTNQNWWRSYETKVRGGYIQMDPIGLAGGLNRPGYAHQNPLSYADPTGEFAIPAFLPLLPLVPIACYLSSGCRDLFGPTYAKPPKNAYDPYGPKAPGKPTESDGFKDPKRGENWVKNPNGRGYGWEAADGGVWCPTGPDSGSTGDAHGGPHWDVQYPGGRYDNIYPGGRRR